jgi:hypothetical protein
MPADFTSEPPAEGLFEAAEAEQAPPPDSDFLNSLIINEGFQGSDSAQG